MIKNKLYIFLVLLLVSSPAYAVFNNIVDGDDVLASPVMQNFRHVNYGSVLKPVDSAGNNNDDTLDLGTNTVRWKDFYYSSQILSPDGSATTPSVTNLDDDDTGVFYPAANSIGFSTNGAESFRISDDQSIQLNSGTILDFGTNTIYDGEITGSWAFDTDTLYVDSSNNRIGIGTNSPQTDLDVDGTFTSRSTNSILRNVDNSNFLASGGTASNLGANIALFGSTHATYPDVLRVRASGTETFRINGSGYVGIGTTSPGNFLTIKGNVDGNGSQVRLINAEGSAYVMGVGGSSASASITDDNGFFIYSTSTGTSLRVSSANGTVGFPDGIDPGYSGASIKMKVVEIGDWNMDSSQTVDVAHGLDIQDIRMVDVIIRGDSSSFIYPLNGKGIIVGSYDTDVQGGVGQITSAGVRLVRITGGFFDDTDFNSTSYNRGWVTIWYSSN